MILEPEKSFQKPPDLRVGFIELNNTEQIFQHVRRVGSTEWQCFKETLFSSVSRYVSLPQNKEGSWKRGGPCQLLLPRTFFILTCFSSQSSRKVPQKSGKPISASYSISNKQIWASGSVSLKQKKDAVSLADFRVHPRHCRPWHHEGEISFWVKNGRNA